MSVIRLLDSTGLNLLDSLSTEYEDSFSLDPFSDTINLHLTTTPPTEFIIARVQTWDPKQPEKAFYSYYNAHNLNKILFQTQVYMEKRLIHRLHVLNPLTNTDIIGHVQYFKIRPSSEALAGVQGESNEKVVEKQTNTTASKTFTTSPVSFNHEKKTKLGLSIKTNILRFVDEPPSAGVREIDSGVIASWTLSAPAAAMILDEQIYNVPSPTNSNQRRLTLLIPKGERLPLMSAPIERTSFSNRPLSPTHMDPVSLMNLSRTSPTIKLGASDKNKTSIPIGAVTRFGVAIGSEELKNTMVYSTRTRQRVYSLANVRNVAGGCKNYDQWIKQVRRAKGRKDVDYDCATTPLSAVNESNERVNIEGDLGYDAVLFATDTDYLEVSKIRAMFRENALTVEEASLFEMKPYHGDDNADSPTFRLLIEDQYQCEMCYPSAVNLAAMPLWKQRWHRTKCLWIAAMILASLIGAIVIIMIKTNQSTLISTDNRQ